MRKYTQRESQLLVESLLKQKKNDVVTLGFIKGSGKTYQEVYTRLYVNGRVLSILHVEKEFNDLIKHIEDNTQPF
jgi:hypothetical protein